MQKICQWYRNYIILFGWVGDDSPIRLENYPISCLVSSCRYPGSGVRAICTIFRWGELWKAILQTFYSFPIFAQLVILICFSEIWTDWEIRIRIRNLCIAGHIDLFLRDRNRMRNQNQNKNQKPLHSWSYWFVSQRSEHNVNLREGCRKR